MNRLDGAALVAVRPEMNVERSASTEAELAAACRAGRRGAFDELVRRTYDRLYRLACFLAGSAAADDVLQETYLAALRGFPAFRGDAKLSTWLISILRNQASMANRSERRRRAASIDGEGPPIPAPEPSRTDERLRGVLDKLRDLPEDLRTALILFHLEGLSYDEIARVMGCPVGTVRSRLFDARERLRKLVPGEDGS
jgi:RNA polymerase sigma-70 factor (ECF subfamily)